MSTTPKKIYVASGNATSSSRLCKFVGDFSHCKNLFGKANHALLLAAEEIYDSSIRRSELFMRLRCRPCKRRLKNFIALQTFVVESFPIGPERKHKVDFFALFYTSRLFSINYSISKFNGHPSHWQGK